MKSNWNTQKSSTAVKHEIIYGKLFKFSTHTNYSRTNEFFNGINLLLIPLALPFIPLYTHKPHIRCEKNKYYRNFTHQTTFFEATNYSVNKKR